MLAFYGLKYREVLELPAMTFWLLNRNIDRIHAEEDIRELQVAASSHSGESIKGMLEQLQKQMGQVLETEANSNPTLDRKALDVLRNL